MKNNSQMMQFRTQRKVDFTEIIVMGQELTIFGDSLKDGILIMTQCEYV